MVFSSGAFATSKGTSKNPTSVATIPARKLALDLRAEDTVQSIAHSPMTTGSKDHSPTTTNTTSRAAKKARPEERGIEIRCGWVKQICGRAAGREQHRNHDGEKQRTQQRVATAGAQKRGREDHTH